jgi:CheY-like chemotaxis protein
MALFNHATREVTTKLVYYGPGLCGKTTNLRWIHDNLSFETKGRLVSLANEADRTLFFDFLPVDLGAVRGMRTRVQVYTVPGQVFRESTRRMVLKGCDAVVFVADSQAAMLDANAESLVGLGQNLLFNEIDPDVPQVIQYNKRDLPTALPIAVLNARLNPRDLPFFEAVALEGTGVEETLDGITRLLFQWLAEHGERGDAAAVSEAARPSARPPVSGPHATPRLQAAEPPRAKEPASPADPPPRGEGLRADQWLYLLDGAQRGPIEIEDLVDLVLTAIPADTKVWHPGLETWVRANHVREIAGEIPPPLPIPGVSRAAEADEDMPDFDTVPRMLRTVLIADEDEAFRRYLAMPLAAQGFTIYESADGSAAWQLAVQNRPWLILADISMPEVDGFEFCRRVRSHPLLARVPLLFISGSDTYKERYRALQIGADDFLSKNLPIRELLMRIQLLMTRYSDLSGGRGRDAAEAQGAFQGRIEVFGAPALLQLCAQGRLTGRFTAVADDAAGTATVLGLREGGVVSATGGATTGVDAVYAFLVWTKGGFRFTPGDPGEGEPLAQSVEHLLLEGCRRIDESRRDADDGGSAFA